MSTHYLSNKNLIAEIAKSKNSYCWFASPDFATPTRYTNSLYGPHKEGCDPFQEGEIVRVYTFDHVPASTITNRSRDHGARGKAPVNFPPFRQYHVRDGELVEVGRSHWKGDLATGHFSADHGRLTNNLGIALMMILERYTQKSNWRGYSYRDEMAGDALAHLVKVALRFHEAKGNNPFSFYTTTIYNEVLRRHEKETRERDIRDDLLFMMGKTPSITRQLADQGVKPTPGKRGRPKKIRHEGAQIAA